MYIFAPFNNSTMLVDIWCFLIVKIRLYSIFDASLIGKAKLILRKDCMH